MNKNGVNFFNIISHLPNALLVLSPDLEIIHASENYLQVTLADSRSIVGKHLFHAFPDNPDDAQASGVNDLRASLQEVFRTKEPQKIPAQKYDVPGPDGTFKEKYWSVINTPVIDEDGQIEYIIHNVTDVTEQVKTEAALDVALGAAQLGTWEIDLITNSFIHRSSRHDEIYGYKELQPHWSHEMARKKILSEDLAVYDQAFAAAVRTGNIDFEVRTQWEDGTIHWMEVKGKVYFTLNGRPSKAAGVNIDVTEQRLAEEAIRKAKEQAEAAVTAKDEFLSTMSHEIRTPLNAVIGISNLMLEDNLTQGQKNNLNSLRFAAGNLLHLVNNVLDFSKIQAGKMEVMEEDFDLSDLIHNLVQTHEPKADKKDLELVRILGPKVPKKICSDPFILSQILNNLIGNALKFTDEGRIVVSVNFYEEGTENRWLRFTVEDTGKGIAPDKLDYIFQKYAQQRNFSEKNQGTGLGLPITKSLVELLGGTIEASSSPGKGAKFSFNLPAIEASLCTEEDNPERKLQEHRELKEKQILLVEDVDVNRSIISQYLKRWWNLEPDEAEDGVQALERVRQKNYDLILMDLRMPNMDGYEATKEIRTIDSYRNVPILAFTAETKTSSKHVHAFDDTIYKPFEPEDLKHKIQKHLIASEKEDIPTPVVKEKKIKETSSFDISRYKSMAVDKPEMLKKFINGSLNAIENYKEEFITVDDEERLSRLIHQNTMNVYYLNAVGLQEKIEIFQSTLKNKKEGEELQTQKKEILEEFDRIIVGLKEVIK